MSDIRVGISGWTYKPWRGEFYPDGLPQKKELAYASRRFNALEINGTFYSLQKPKSFQNWYEQTPDDFLFAIKGNRYLTHMRKLRDPQQPLANFFASGLLCLREKLGPILWQFPPQMSFHEEEFESFLSLLPKDTYELAKLGEKHDGFMKGKVDLEPDAKRRVRHAVEFRHESFLNQRFITLLRKYHISLVIADVAGKYPTTEDVTSEFLYLRLHGARKLYQSGYTNKEIAAWSEKIKLWSEGKEPPDARTIVENAKKPPKSGRDIYLFFDNTDVKLRAPVDAREMAKTLGVGPTESVSAVLKDLGVKSETKKRSSA